LEKYSYLQGVNAAYIDQLYESYLADPESVDSSWRLFFEGLEFAGAQPPTAEPKPAAAAQVVGTPKSGTYAPGVMPDESDEAKVGLLIQSYRELGRLNAKLDPLGDRPPEHELLSIERFALTPADRTRIFNAGKIIGMGPSTLDEIVERLREIYCGHIGVEYTHIEDADSRNWLRTRMEYSRNKPNLDVATQKRILLKLAESEAFETFLHTRYVGQKRFSGEGADALIPLVDCLIQKGGELGVKEMVYGMAHRGRLNMLVNIFGKHPSAVFSEFEGRLNADKGAGEGDVKYHMGFSSNVLTHSGANVHLSLASNPSHLEAVDPVVEGITRAKQEMYEDVTRSQVVPVLIHGDASFAGQGLVYETLQLSKLPGYATGGTVHIVINNQIGFTTGPAEARSTTYATDLAMMLEIPIFHVNGDDPEALFYIGELVMEYRQKFHRDVVIDLICYRRHGHNEGDEPAFTQPLMYKKIKDHPTPRALYARQLIEQNVVTEDEAKGIFDDLIQNLTQAQETARTNPPPLAVSVFESRWRGLRKPTPDELYMPAETGVKLESLHKIAASLTAYPEGFTVHPKLEKILAGRRKAVEDGADVDWGTAEALAYGSLLQEGTPVRVSGQDSERGTFSHRHAVLYDFHTGVQFTPLGKVQDSRATFYIYNSPLSEQGVLGFEFGYAMADPKALTVWEAQFGDFANGAQIIIDQFITTAESKWNRMNGLVMLLPHGYEGQGPEHSSCRLERFLQSCGRYNMQVCNLTTPAQIFHALRRQIHRPFRKPLIIASPKSLLRHPLAVSDVNELVSGRFHELLDDTYVTAREKVKRIILCSGKVYYELHQERERLKRDDIAILRLEQFYPWPENIIAEMLKTFPENAEVMWVQEEPRNMGGWVFVRERWLDGTLGERKLLYAGRPMAAAPAVGSSKSHAQEQKQLLEQALSDL
jgi:2-oxoglutarate dehydrogenase E1 component